MDIEAALQPVRAALRSTALRQLVPRQQLDVVVLEHDCSIGEALKVRPSPPIAGLSSQWCNSAAQHASAPRSVVPALACVRTAPCTFLYHKHNQYRLIDPNVWSVTAL